MQLSGQRNKRGAALVNTVDTKAVKKPLEGKDLHEAT